MPPAQPTRLILLGDPVAHSLSPTFQNAALRSANVPLVYEALKATSEELPRIARELRAQGAAGNITIPHKEAFALLCDVRTPLAEQVGAVNTFWCEDNMLVGDNTDVHGVMASIDRLVAGDLPPNSVCAVIGAGGSAAATIAALVARGVERIHVWGRTPARVTQLQHRFGKAVLPMHDVNAAVENAALVINCTPVGLHDDSEPVAVETLPAGCAVLDLVYKSGETAWVRSARSRGHRAMDGLYMLVEQGAAAYERWFGVAPNRDAMWQGLGEYR